MKEITVEALKENLQTVMAFLDDVLEQADCPMKLHMQINVAVDEVFTNIAMYAYPSGSGQATVRIHMEEETGMVCITFTDRGIAYNPLEQKSPDVTLSAEERPIGGLGIFLVRKMMDDISYEYSDGQNILTLRKKIR